MTSDFYFFEAIYRNKKTKAQALSSSLQAVEIDRNKTTITQ